MAKKNVHVVPAGNGWEVKREGGTRPISTHRTQGNAEDAGRRLAKTDKVELVTHRPNGQDPGQGQLRERPVPSTRPKALRSTTRPLKGVTNAE